MMMMQAPRRGESNGGDLFCGCAGCASSLLVVKIIG